MNKRRDEGGASPRWAVCDGSPHDWFEGRAACYRLLLFIDDATSRLMAAGVFSAETTAAYMTVLGTYVLRHGRPLAVYSDRHSIFLGQQAVGGASADAAGARGAEVGDVGEAPNWR